jgi:hypothetical protein
MIMITSVGMREICVTARSHTQNTKIDFGGKENMLILELIQKQVFGVWEFGTVTMWKKLN